MAVVNINSPLEDLVSWFTSHPSQREKFLINNTEFIVWYDYLGSLRLEVDGERFAWPTMKSGKWQDWTVPMDSLRTFAQNYADEIAARKDETVQQGITLMELFEAESC